MGFQTPTGWPQRCTMETSAPGVHQIRFVTDFNSPRGWAMTCTCRETGHPIARPADAVEGLIEWSLFHREAVTS